MVRKCAGCYPNDIALLGRMRMQECDGTKTLTWVQCILYETLLIDERKPWVADKVDAFMWVVRNLAEQMAVN